MLGFSCNNIRKSNTVHRRWLKKEKAFSWLKFCASAWEQESILMPDTSSLRPFLTQECNNRGVVAMEKIK